MLRPIRASNIRRIALVATSRGTGELVVTNNRLDRMCERVHRARRAQFAWLRRHQVGQADHDPRTNRPGVAGEAGRKAVKRGHRRAGERCRDRGHRITRSRPDRFRGVDHAPAADGDDRPVTDPVEQPGRDLVDPARTGEDDLFGHRRNVDHLAHRALGGQQDELLHPRGAQIRRQTGERRRPEGDHALAVFPDEVVAGSLDVSERHRREMLRDRRTVASVVFLVSHERGRRILLRDQSASAGSGDWPSLRNKESPMEDQGISEENVAALAGITNAIRATGSVAEEAIRHVEAKLEQATESSKWRIESEQVYFARFSWMHESWLPLEFTFRPDAGMPDSTGALVFMAGITYAMGRDPFSDAHVENTLSDDFKTFMSPDSKGRIMRILKPEALLTAGTKSDQARLLSDWILESFDLIRECFAPGASE